MIRCVIAVQGANKLPKRIFGARNIPVTDPDADFVMLCMERVRRRLEIKPRTQMPQPLSIEILP